MAQNQSTCCRNMTGIVAALIGGAIASASLAYVYAHAQLAIPVLYVNGLMCVAFGAMLGAIPSATLRRWGVEGSVARAGVVAFCGIAGYYLAWVIWISTAMKTVTGQAQITVSALAFHPAEVVQMAMALLDSGTWSIGLVSHDRIHGVSLLIVWIVEAIVIFGMSIVTSRMFFVAQSEENVLALRADVTNP